MPLIDQEKLPWDQENWHIQVDAWLKQALKKHHLNMIAPPVEVHHQPWSVVYRIKTETQDLYLKALCPALRHENRLTCKLSEWQPDLIHPVIETDDSRGWMLMPDGGQTLRQLLTTDRSLEYWKQILPAYARFQIEMFAHSSDLVRLGVKDRRLHILPDAFVGMLSDQQSLLIDQPEGLTAKEYEQLSELEPKFRQLCQQLSDFGIPESLEHDDFHDGNVFYNPGRFRFFDWAESFLAHPFFSLVVNLRSIAYRFSLAEDSLDLVTLRNLYLKEWQRYASLGDLQQAFRLAMIIGRFNRALTWNMVVSTLPEPYRTKESDAFPGWLKLFLEKIIAYPDFSA